MQDVPESQAVSTLMPGQGSTTTPSASRSYSSSKPSKESQEIGNSRQTEGKKSPSKASYSSKTNHDTARGESSSPQDKPKAKDIRNGGRRGSDADKIVPVKKRHLGTPFFHGPEHFCSFELSIKQSLINNPFILSFPLVSLATSVSPVGGPRMVPIHELDDLIRPDSNSSPGNHRKHGYADDDDDDAHDARRNGRTKQRKNGFVRSHQTEGSHSAADSTRSTQKNNLSPHQSLPSADDSLSLYATKNLYTNNTATFPLHFPTISIGFGPNNAYYTYPNCAVILFENHFQIKLIQGGERTEIDVWKEGIEGTEFQVVDVGDGESMIVMKALLRQYLTR
jgi:hypothetical protein